MWKTMLLNNWFSTLGGVVIAAMDAYKSGIGWRQALIIGVGCIMRDGIPGIKTGGQAQ